MRELLQEYLESDGLAGEMYDFYPLIKAARYLGVAPWELAKQPVSWLEWARIAQRAEDGASRGEIGAAIKAGQRKPHIRPEYLEDI